MIIGNGQQVDIWYDSWADVGPLFSLFPLLHFPPAKKLNSFREGNTGIIPRDIPSNVAVTLWRSLQNVNLQRDIEDSLVWKAHPGKDLTFKEAWQLTRPSRAGSMGSFCMEFSSSPLCLMFCLEIDARLTRLLLKTGCSPLALA